MQTIRCSDMDDFVACVARLAREGLAFDADASRLTITITGY